jgi:hypothetical protein
MFWGLRVATLPDPPGRAPADGGDVDLEAVEKEIANQFFRRAAAVVQADLERLHGASVAESNRTFKKVAAFVKMIDTLHQPGGREAMGRFVCDVLGVDPEKVELQR